MTDTFIEYMVDVETDGLLPYRNGITSIAIIPWDLNGACYDSKTIHTRVLPMPFTKSNVETMAWREANNVTAREADLPQCTPNELLKQIDKLVYSSTYIPRFWSKPATFDYPFLMRIYEYFNWKSPFHYRNVVDLRSFIIGSGFDPEEVYAKNAIPEDRAHDAFADAWYQIHAAQFVASNR